MKQPDVLPCYKGDTIQSMFGNTVVICLYTDDIVEEVTSGNMKQYVNQDFLTQYFDSAAKQDILKKAIENNRKNMSQESISHI